MSWRKRARAVADEIVRERRQRPSFTSSTSARRKTPTPLVAAAEKTHGGIDAIVANAGIAHRVPLASLDDEKWDHTFDIDLKGIFRVVRPAVAGMRARKKGAIVCLSSIMGVAYGWDEHVHYSSAKAGVVGLVRGLAVELAKDGVRVNGVAPGYIRTAQLLSEEHSLGRRGRGGGGRVHSDGPDRRARRDRRRHRVSGVERRPLHDGTGGGGGRRIARRTVLNPSAPPGTR